MRRILGLALVAAALPTGAANAHVYWANKYDDAIGRAPLIGGAADQEFIDGLPAGSHPVGLAVDRTHVYWSGFEADSVGRARLNGTQDEPNFVAGASGPVGVAVDGRYVYWTNSATGTIGRVPRAGGTPDQDFIGVGGSPYGLAVDAHHVYWADNATGHLGRARIDGSQLDQDFITDPVAPTALAVRGRYLYWVSSAGGAIGRAPLDGGAPDPHFIPTPNDPWGLAVDAAHLYWTNQGPPKTIGRARLDGTSIEQSFLSASATGVYGVAAAPPDTRIGEGTIALRSALFSFSASEPAAFECRTDGGPFSPCASPSPVGGLANGSHRFAVRAISAGSPDPTPATRAWLVAVATQIAEDRRPPGLAELRLSRRSFRAGTRVRVRYMLDEQAQVRFVVMRKRAGRRVDGGCRHPKLAPAGAGRCSLRLRGALTHPGAQGANRLRFKGRWRGRKLRRGRYLLVGTATDAAGNASPPARVAFRIRRPR